MRFFFAGTLSRKLGRPSEQEQLEVSKVMGVRQETKVFTKSWSNDLDDTRGYLIVCCHELFGFAWNGQCDKSIASRTFPTICLVKGCTDVQRFDRCMRIKPRGWSVPDNFVAAMRH